MRRVGKSDTLLVLQTQLVDMFQTTRKSILEWEKDGMPVRPVAGGKRYNLYEVLPWLKSRWEQERTSEGDSPNLERYRLARAEREELELAIKRGRYIATSDAAAWWMDRVVEARTALQSLGQAVAPAVVGLTVSAAQKAIDDRCRAICESLARAGTDALSEGAEPVDETEEDV